MLRILQQTAGRRDFASALLAFRRTGAVWMFAEAATSETAGAFTDATMHATGVKHVLQAGVFDEADGASMSSGKAGGPIRATVCLFGTFVSDFRIDFRFRRYKSTLVSGFDFRIGLSFTKVKKKHFRFPFPKQRIARDTKVGWVTKVKSQQKPTSDFVWTFVSDFRTTNCLA